MKGALTAGTHYINGTYSQLMNAWYNVAQRGSEYMVTNAKSKLQKDYKL